MTNLDPRPPELEIATPSGGGPVVELLEDREVPLGGLRAMTVRRTLPQRARSTVGAWCFVDAFGPGSSEPMRVLPHPHTGLQTVTWPVRGEIRHRDSLGSDLRVRPGELDLMTAGRGVAHSEISDVGGLAGVQLWAALPDGVVDPAFEHVADLPRWRAEGVVGTVFVGAIGDAVSPATVHTPLLGADLEVSPGATARVPVDPAFEHALLVLDGEVTVDDVPVPVGPLAFLGTRRAALVLTAGAAGARLLLLGGEPFTDPLVMFWNFVGRTHDDVAAARADWEADATLAPGDAGRRFGTVPGHGRDRIPAPSMPPVRLRPRERRAPAGS